MLSLPPLEFLCYYPDIWTRAKIVTCDQRNQILRNWMII